MKTRVVAVFWCALLGLASANAAPLSTAFTYQGQLTDGGLPANGRYDVEFSVYESPTEGSLVAGPLTNTVELLNGSFTVTLDFGAPVFVGDARWLQLALRTNGVAADFTPLSPRQSLTPSPYAIYALNAGTAATASSAVTAVTAYGVANGAVSSAGIAGDQVVKSLNGLRDDVTLSAGTNLSLTPNGNTLTLATPTDWHAEGNAGTAAGTHFLGTTDNEPLEFKVNRVRALRLEPTPTGGPNVIGGYAGNRVSPGIASATIAGGGSEAAPHLVSGSGGTVGGGAENQALGMVAIVAGGQANVAAASGAAIGGGAGNTIAAAADFGVIAGGAQNHVGGPYGFAAGRRANANHPGSFVWADSTAADFASTTSDQFAVRAGGGVRVQTGGAGMTLDGQAVATTPVPTAALADNSVTSAKIADGAVGNADLANNAVGGSKILDGGVGASDLADDAVTSAKIADGTIQNADVGTLSHLTASDGSPANAVSVDSVGRVGVGTASPAQTLDVAGHALVRGPSWSPTNYAALYLGDGNHYIRSLYGYGVQIGTWQAPQGITLLEGTGLVGIGTTTPTARLHVQSAGGQPQLFLEQTASADWARLRLGGGGHTWDLSVRNANEPSFNFWNGSANVAVISYFGTVTATAFNATSDRNAKEHFETVDGQQVLEKVAALPISRWNFKTDHQVQHIGPVAQDFHAAFGVGTDDRHIATVDADGVALAAIQGLNQKLEASVKAKDVRIALLEQDVAELRALVQSLAEKVNRGGAQ